MRETPIKQLLPGTGKIAPAPLQESMLQQHQVLKDVLPDVETTMRMALFERPRDIPATGPLAIHRRARRPRAGFWAYLRGLPHAAKLAQEGPGPDLAANVARFLGTQATGAALAPEEKR